MSTTLALERADHLGPADELSDEEVVSRVLAGDRARFETLMRRYNRRLFRAAFSVLRDHAEAEDVVQDCYLRAYAHLAQFRGEARFSTWLTRIVINEALARVRSRRRELPLVEDQPPAERARGRNEPESRAHAGEVRQALEAAIAKLPAPFRAVFMLRQIEGLSTKETAESLGIAPDTVKTRLYRGRQLLQRDLRRDLPVLTAELFPFGFARCDHLVARVLGRLTAAHTRSGGPRR